MPPQGRFFTLRLLHAFWGTIRALTCVAALSGLLYCCHLTMSPQAPHVPTWACVLLLLAGLYLYNDVAQATSVASPHLGTPPARQPTTLFRKEWRTITAACGLMAFGLIALFDHLSSSSTEKPEVEQVISKIGQVGLKVAGSVLPKVDNDLLPSVVDPSPPDSFSSILASLPWKLAVITIASYALSAVFGIYILSGFMSSPCLPRAAD